MSDTNTVPNSPQMAGCQQEPCSLSSDTPETDAALVDHMPELVLANEQKNPAWSKSEIWGIERDIIPSVRALCWSAAHLLPENS
jgi:hypothetical protein